LICVHLENQQEKQPVGYTQEEHFHNFTLCENMKIFMCIKDRLLSSFFLTREDSGPICVT
jgi:hypothetical protein